MSVEEYFSSVADGFEFLIAFFSLLGFLGILAGFGILFLGAVYDDDPKEILHEMKAEAYDALKSSENDLNYSTKEFKNFLKKQKEP